MTVIENIDREIARLREARSLLVGAFEKRKQGRPRGPLNTSSTAEVRSKRTMSPEGRARIAAAQKKRWAKQRGGNEN